MADVRKRGWVLVVPVKRLSTAKSRLRGVLPGVPHERLALALAQDTVAAALACPAVADVLVVTPDPVAASALAALGARVEPDPPAPTVGPVSHTVGARPDPDARLNAAVAHGAARAAGSGRRVAVLTADLPALRPDELAAALALAGDAGPAFVADAAGTGTTLLVAPADGPLEPRFGPGSARAHREGGARPLDGPLRTLRRDVDTPADLAAAGALGLGRHTRAVTGYGPGMQGTVATYDPDTRSGTLLLDDGTELTFPTAAFEASGLRLLRLGQRVRVERDAANQVILVTLPTW